jgi:hypothetical protein
MTDITYDSKEEQSFVWYLDELKEKGFIFGYKYQPKPFILFDKVYYNWEKQLKTKVNIEQSPLLNDYSYQADFIIFWHPSAEHLFFEILHNPMPKKIEDIPFLARKTEKSIHSIIDIKGTFNQNDAYRRFSIDQKMVWNKFEIYVQKVIPYPSVSKVGKIKPVNALFHQTFTPFKFLFTDVKRDRKKLRYNVRTIREYIESKA